NVGVGGRGFSGVPDGMTVTDSNGQFSFTSPIALPDGVNDVRVVVVGPTDAPPLPGLSSARDQTFRIDTTNPLILTSTIPSGATIPALSTISFNVADPVAPSDPTSPLAVPVGLNYPALDPATADNISNYSLINLGPDGQLGTADDRDFSSFVTAANFVSTT